MKSCMDTLSRSTKSAFPNSGLSCSAMVSPVPPVKVKRPKCAGMRRRQKGGHGPVLRGQLLPARCGFSSSNCCFTHGCSAFCDLIIKHASEKDANSGFPETEHQLQNIPKFRARGESLHLCAVTPRATFARFPGLSLLSVHTRLLPIRAQQPLRDHAPALRRGVGQPGDHRATVSAA